MRELKRHRLALAILAASTAALFVLTGTVAASGKPVAKPGGEDVARNKTAFFDSRQAPAAQLKLDARAAALDSNPPAATANLKDSLGVEGFVNLDPLTGTVRDVGSTDGFLTGPSSASAASVALGYVTKNASAFGLTTQGLQAFIREGLRLDRRDTPSLVHPEDQRYSRLRQRLEGERHEGRPGDQRGGLALGEYLR